MDQQKVRDILSGDRKGAAATTMRGLLSAASSPYSAFMKLRRWSYRKGILPSRSAGAPVICIGNITTGGTGKTPMSAWAVEQLTAAGRTPAILTRGYKKIEGVSDEATLLERLCNVPVIVNPDRVAGAAEAVAGGADVLVMDDGFQHCRLRRDLDILLIDATNPFGYGHCLPRGLLREQPGVLREADAIVITRSDAVSPERVSELRGRIADLAPGVSIHAAVHRPTKFIDENGQPLPLDAVSGRKVCAFCGIGNPQQFFECLSPLYARVVARLAFDDHAVFTPEAFNVLRDACEGGAAELLVTTQKDFVRMSMAGGGELPRPVWQLAAEMQIVEGEGELLARLLAAAGGE